MTWRVAASSATRRALLGPRRRARILGATSHALYLGLEQTVLAVVSADAVRLPCALVLPIPAAETPFRSLLGLPATVGGGAVRVGPADFVAGRFWRPARVRPGADPVSRGARLRAVLEAADIGVPAADVAALGADVADDGVALLGRGPGLTPAGDDVLAGFLLGARAFAVSVSPVRRLVAERARSATTALSAELLVHAAAGVCIPQVADLFERGDARRLLAVGHTSGPAMAAGILRAAELASSAAAAA